MKRILGLCFHMVWEYRFTGNWLARSAKVSDKSFAPPNEANWTRAQEESGGVRKIRLIRNSAGMSKPVPTAAW